MYSYNGVVIPSFQIYERLKQEKRRTKPCPFCQCKRINPAVLGVMFFMECTGCGATGPCVADYHDPLGLNATSWVYALKVCHDRWNVYDNNQYKTRTVKSNLVADKILADWSKKVDVTLEDKHLFQGIGISFSESGS